MRLHQWTNRLQQALLLVCVIMWGTTHIFGQAEYIDKFDVTLRLQADGWLVVEEKIRIKAAGIKFRRGLERTLPRYRKDQYGRAIEMNYDWISFAHNGKAARNMIDRLSSDWRIRIGNPNVFIAKGFHEYIITYRVSGQVGFFEDYDELYWNVNGLGWDFSIQEIYATVQLPEGAQYLDLSCYTGRRGSKATDCTAQDMGEGVARFAADNLGAGENLTIAPAFPKGIINEPPPPPPPSFFERYGLLLVSGLLFLGLMAYYIFTWWRYGVDPPSPTVIPEFHPPRGFSPAIVGFYDKERYWNDLVSASIINLAVKGFVKIKDVSSKHIFGMKTHAYELHRLKPADDTLSEEEARLMNGFFVHNDVLAINGAYDAKIRKTLSNHKIQVVNGHRGLVNQGNNRGFLLVPILALFAYLFFAISMHQEILSGWLAIFIPIGVGLVFLSTIVRSILRAVGVSFKLKWILPLVAVLLLLTPVGVYHYFYQPAMGLAGINQIVFLFLVVFTVLSIVLYGYLIKKPAEQKLAIQAEIKGLEMYIKTAEENQMQFHNPPKMTPEHFEELLPYAIVFGIDEIWGENFKKLVDKSLMQQEYRPGWYDSPDIRDIYFAHHLQSALSNVMSRSMTPPQAERSRGDFGSGSWGGGSFGGGFSGGGGGGGGGGGW